jgi:hypothetical protein
MKYPKTLLLCAGLFIITGLKAQEFSKDMTVSLFTGLINYQGDLNPNSFTFQNSNFAAGIGIRKPISRWFSVRAGINIGKIEAADRNNRDYLKPRNLSFTTNIKEAYAGLELTLLNSATSRITPYMYAGVAVFHFNPWTYDNNGQKTYLQPLGTEGQGLPQYPSQKMYKLTQLSLPFGGGIRYAVNDAINIGIEFSQRKSFTDYIDDVSTSFIDQDVLLQGRGAKAVELAYRGDEVPGGVAAYPMHGEQRGTPSEMDWYYFLGTTIEIKLNAIGSLFRRDNSMHGSYNLRCPRKITY